jgi:hypothetical protein
MTSPEDLALLREYAVETSSGQWVFTEGSAYAHDTESALAIIKADLALDVRVTDILTAQTWHKAVMRIVALESRVDELEAAA